MLDALFQIDKTILLFCNTTIANPVFDVVMPFITDLNKHWYGFVIYGAALLLLIWKGGRKGRTLALLVIVLVAFSDQLSSSVLKRIVARPRPCHEIAGMVVVEQVRLVIPCGGGTSFPSSHAVNNFAVAAFLSFYYRRWRWAFYSFAGIVAFSRVYLGVHFPSDVVGGAAIGMACTYVVIWLWADVERWFPKLRFSPQEET